MRFPTASWPAVRNTVGQVILSLPGARRRLALACLLLALGAAANVSIPISLGRIVDVVVASDGGPAGIVWIVAMLAAAAGVAAASSAAGFYLLARIAEKVIARLREHMVGTALSLPTHKVEEAGSGDLVSRSTDDVAELSSAVTETIPVLSSSLFAIAATATALVGLDWRYLLVVICAVPVYWLAARAYLAVAPSRYAAERAAMAGRARRVLEGIHGKATVKAFGMEEDIQGRIRESSREVVEHGYAARRTLMVLQLWITTVELVMLTTGLLVGWWALTSGQLSTGAITGAMLMLIRLRGPLMGLMRVLDTVQSGYASLSRIVGVVQDPPLPVPDAGAPEPRGEVDVRGLSFAYPGSSNAEKAHPTWAVRGVDLHIRPGGTVALVGASGAGKTTVAALVAGLRVPDEGSVRIDGVEVASLSDAERAARLAMVSQEVHVFSGSLREDLQLAKPDATDSQLRAALERVQAGWVDELAEGLDTEVGAQGMRLDPVAAQQLALARILLKDPKVVVMDEATAEAGSAGANLLEEAAAEVTRGRSALIVAHRLDQAMRADEILVMDEGRVVERGRHSQLLDYGGRYFTLWNAWQKGRA